MPGKRGSMGQIIAELLFRILTEILLAGVGAWLLDVPGYYTAKMILPAISLGHIYVAPERPTPPLLDTRPPASFYVRQPNGTIIVSPDVACWIGLLIWILALVLWLFLHWAASP
jgi:hypothetical protein